MSIPSRLSFEAVEVRYPGRRTPSLDGLSFSVASGELLGVAGRTGAGKSTLTMVAAGFVPRVVRATFAGRLLLDGEVQDPTGGPSLAGRVGIVFSTPANQLSASKLTVRDEVAFGLENLGVPRGEMDGRIDAALTTLGIDHLADREPFALSGGEQQRVAIASMVAMGSDVLVLDEPTAQLDPAATLTVARMLDALAAQGAAVICTGHDPDVLGGMDRCLLLAAGQMAAMGVPGEVLASRTLAPQGMAAPTIVRLAEAVGVPPERSFDPEAIVQAIDRGLPPGLLTPAPPTPTEGRPVAAEAVLPAWSPVSGHEVPMIEVTRLVHRYGDVEAVRGISLAIEPGERVAIVGQNGSGKTTLVKHFVGLLRPTAGTVRLSGRDIGMVPIHALAGQVGFVFQDPDDQLFSRTVEREVRFGPVNLGLGPDVVERLVGQALETVGLTGERATNPYDLDVSGRKLVALASILAMDPAVLVLDEPTTGQDGPGVARVGSVVDAVAGAGRTVIAITHDMEFAAAHFGRIIVMRAGEVVADGAPGEVFAPGSHTLLESTGLLAPVVARIAARLGLKVAPLTVEALLAAVAHRA
jgi:energy-coupling factor transport system ATP-binding protein